jgi:DNA-binding transcriptional MerR regulator
MKLSISETSKLMGISVRTLHYYDEIGLLKPSETSEAGYRYYDDRSIELLQQILFFRELDFPLKEIGRILTSPEFDRTQALKRHRELLLLKQKQLGDLIRLVDDTLGGKESMENQKFTDYEEAKAAYTEEARAKWGNTAAYGESEARGAKRSKAENNAVMSGAGKIFEEFAALRTKAPSDPQVQAAVARWQAFITDNFYSCTDEILSGLGKMYVADSRFTENIDSYGQGTAQFLSDAIRVYCGK